MSAWPLPPAASILSPQLCFHLSSRSVCSLDFPLIFIIYWLICIYYFLCSGWSRWRWFYVKLHPVYKCGTKKVLQTRWLAFKEKTCNVCIASDFRETLFFVNIYAVKVEGVVYVIMCRLSLFILSKLYACLAVRACWLFCAIWYSFCFTTNALWIMDSKTIIMWLFCSCELNTSTYYFKLCNNAIKQLWSICENTMVVIKALIWNWGCIFFFFLNFGTEKLDVCTVNVKLQPSWRFSLDVCHLSLNEIRQRRRSLWLSRSFIANANKTFPAAALQYNYFTGKRH